MTSVPETARRPLWRDPILATAVAVILIMQGIVVWRALPRALDHDEGEHLRAAAWMASGRTLYRDFAENHTPFLYMILVPLAPAAGEGGGPARASDDIAATRHYTMIARSLSAIAGIGAVLCIAGVAAHLAGDAMAVLPVLAALLASSWTWLRGVADVRSEPYTLLLFWAGALLVVKASSASRRALLVAGAGIGLIAVADLWNPKWPLESLVLLGLYTAYLFKDATRVAPAASPAEFSGTFNRGRAGDSRKYRRKDRRRHTKAVVQVHPGFARHRGLAPARRVVRRLAPHDTSRSRLLFVHVRRRCVALVPWSGGRDVGGRVCVLSFLACAVGRHNRRGGMDRRLAG